MILISCNTANDNYSNDIFIILYCIMNETVVETNSAAMCGARICNHCQSNFEITQWDLDFYHKISPTFAGQRFHIPTPTLCPDCRQRRRLSFRNERKLYRRICDATQQPIISIYSPDKPYKVYDQKMRRSDSRDPMDYGFEFDFTKTFTENFRELMVKVPRMSLVNDYTMQDNSEYINLAWPSKNCYLIFETNNCEECLYSYLIRDSKNCLDSDYIHDCSVCYESFSLKNCHNCTYCFACNESSFLELCSDCINCSHCLMCYGLEWNKYCINNKQYTKEEYDKKITSIRLSSSKEDLNQQYRIWLQENNYKPYFIEYWNENVTGKMTVNSFNSSNIEFCQWVEDCKYCMLLNDSKDCYDFTSRWENSSLIYEVHNTWNNCQNQLFSEFCWMNCCDILYSNLCPVNNSNLFGCVWLRNKQYCIFNRQYTKQEYEIQVAKIIQHMMTTGERGEFFHPSLSPFGYNETVAQEYYPLHAVGASLASPDNDHNHDGQGKPNPYAGIDFADHGYSRSNYQAPTPQSDKIIKGSELPDIITTVEDSILQYAISCEVTGQLFRIQAQELVFYRKHNIPLPRKHPDQRHLERLALRK